MKELFPAKQVAGFVFSLVLTIMALTVYYLDVSFAAGMAILVITAFVQAFLQFVVFMHAGETKDKWYIYGNIIFMIVASLVTIFGTLLLFLWDM